MKGTNIVVIGGNLTRDVDLKYTPNGKAVAILSVAVNNSFKKKDGELKEEVCYLDVEVWDKQAETCAEYLKKGSSVLVEGSLKQDSWTDKESGAKRSRHKIRGRRVHFIGGGKGRREEQEGEEDGQQSTDHTEGDDIGPDGKSLPPF